MKGKPTDEEIIEAINGIEDVPTFMGVSRALRKKEIRYSNGSIQRRSEENREIQAAMEARGIAFIDSLSDQDLFLKINGHGWMTGLPEYASAQVNKKVAALIIKTIGEIEDVPTFPGISRALNEKGIRYDGDSVQKRAKENEKIQEAMEARGAAFIEGLSDQDLFLKINGLGWMTGLPEYASAQVNKKVAALIIKTIGEIEDVPTFPGISRALNEKGIRYDGDSVQKRAKENEKIQEAMEARGIAFIDSLSYPELFLEINRTSWMQTLPEYAKKQVNKRVDSLILEILENRSISTAQIRQGTVRTISEELRRMGIAYSMSAIYGRINANPKLWKAYFHDSGITIDQALGLTVKPDNHLTPAQQVTLEERLPNLEVYREACALVNLLFGSPSSAVRATVEVSNYHSVIYAASGGTAAVDFIPSPLAIESGIPYADRSIDTVVMPQTVHQIRDNANLDRLLLEAFRILREGGRLILTMPPECSLGGSALDGLSERYGFTLTESLERHTHASEESLRGLDDPKRMKDKVEGSSNVFVFEKTGVLDTAAASFVEILRKGELASHEAMPHGSLEITVPREINDALQHRLIADLAGPLRSGKEGPVMLSVYGEKGLSFVIAHDMDPIKPQSVEWYATGSERLSPDVIEALIKSFRDFVGSGDENPLRIVRGRETRVSKYYVRRALLKS